MKRGFLKINGGLIPTLLAITSEEQEKGLMHIKPPAPTMSFVYDRPRINSFWMKNTPAPLDIVFCNDNKIIKICEGKPNSTELIGTVESNLVVEFPKGYCKENNIQEGDSITLINYPNPSKEQLEKKAPLKPWLLVDALQDRVHSDIRSVRIAKTTRR